MYLLARQAVVRGQDALKWSVDIGPPPVRTRGRGRGVGHDSLARVGTVDVDIALARPQHVMDKSMATLMSDASTRLGGRDEEVHQRRGRRHVIPDRLRGFGSAQRCQLRIDVTAVCAPGNFARGMMSGLEVAQKAEADDGRVSPRSSPLKLGPTALSRG